MKQNKAVLFLSLFLVLFLESFSAIEWKDRRLVGQWKISEVIYKDEKVNIDKIPYCENKENIEFRDSTLTWENFVYFKNRCFKDITKANYVIGYNSLLKTYSNNQNISNYAILELDDSALTLKINENTVKSYKKIK
jgi:hypothetical protein